MLIGSEVAEVRASATFLAPANTVHAMRNIGSTPVRWRVIADPSVNVGTYFVDGVEFELTHRARAEGGALELESPGD